MEKVKKGGEEEVVGHMIRVKCVKNKTAPPFRKAEFMIYYDGRELSKTQELTDVLLNKGMIPRYKADGTLDAKGRNYRFEYDGEVLEAKKRDDVYQAMEQCPKIQEYFLEKLKSGEIEPVDYETDEFDGMSEDDFLNSLNSNESEAEEIEDEDWTKI